MKLVDELKSFLLRGNVMDLAVGVIIGGAFGKIISSLVNDMIMPVIGAILKGVDFKALALTVGSASITYGNFLQTVLEFLIIGLLLFFIIKAMNKALPKKKAEPPSPKEDIILLTEIRDLLKKG